MVSKQEREEMAAAIEEVLNLHNIQIDALEKQAATEEGDFTGILAQTEERFEELRAQADEMLKKSGMTQEQLEEYVANKANFSPAEWELMENTKKTCTEMRKETEAVLEKHIPQDIREAAEKPPAPKKKRKKKKMAKRKDWLQM